MKAASKALLVSVLMLATLAVMPALGAKDKKNNPPREGPPGSYLIKQVGHELRMLPYYSLFDNLEYKVNGYHVTLYGQVVRPTTKSAAENVVKQIEGVQSVTNNIKVLPLSTMDDRIRLEEYRAIFSEASLNKYALQAVPPIHIIVDNGHVTLVGVVANEMDKNLAGIRAKSVPGVFSVVNNLRVQKK